MKISIPFVFVVLAVSLFSKTTMADVEIDKGFFVENDLRLAVDRGEALDFNYNRTTLGGDLKAELIPGRLRVVGDLRFVWTGFSKNMEFDGLSELARVSPYYFESRAAYIEILSLFPGIDLRIGRQIVNWGAADMFNPTNNLNAVDLEDPLKFGENLANEMIRIDWTPDDSFFFQGVFVPLFQPALLPPSARRAIGDPASEFPFVDPEVRLKAERLRNIWLRNPDLYIIDRPVVDVHMPSFSLASSQFGLKVTWTSGLFDMSLSYYQGIDPMPAVALSKSSTRTTGKVTPDGVPKIGVETDVDLVFPKKKVLGFDLTGQIPLLDDLGFWFEGAFVFPEQILMKFDVTEVAPGSQIIDGDTVERAPFFKFTTGMDYSINQYLFLTGQFIHGFVDEFSASKINNYWVSGMDVKLFQEKFLLRFFVVGELPHDDTDITLDANENGKADSHAIGATSDGVIASYVLFPQVTWKPLDGLELILGGYFLMGHRESKFAQNAAGSSLVVFRANASF